MTPTQVPESPELLAKLYQQFRDYFDKAEKKRRWNIALDIPWGQCNRSLPQAVGDVLESFCAVELYLPDYLSKLIPQVRANRGRAWMLANWGYEESKHSMVFGDWLLKSGMRSDEQMADMEREVFSHEWNLPYDNALGMVIYTTFQELATWLTYVNLRKYVQAEGGDPALERALSLVAIDERAHYDFFRKLVSLYLEHDRPSTLEQLRRVANTFQMPALHLLSDSRQRMEDIKQLRLFDEEQYVFDVFEPVLAALKVEKHELRRRPARERMAASAK